MSDKGGRTWTTADEETFIRRIGAGEPELAIARLRLYRRALGLRRVWVGISREQVFAFTDWMIEELQKKQQKGVAHEDVRL